MSGTVQQEFDDLARANGWQVTTAPGESVYARGRGDADPAVQGRGNGIDGR